MLSPPLKTPTGGGTAILCNQALTRASAMAIATMSASFALALSVMNVTSVSVNWPLLDLYFMKPKPKVKEYTGELQVIQA